jgi:hypothetical protein
MPILTIIHSIYRLRLFSTGHKEAKDCVFLRKLERKWQTVYAYQIFIELND